MGLSLNNIYFNPGAHFLKPSKICMLFREEWQFSKGEDTNQPVTICPLKRNKHIATFVKHPFRAKKIKSR